MFVFLEKLFLRLNFLKCDTPPKTHMTMKNQPVEDVSSNKKNMVIVHCHVVLLLKIYHVFFAAGEPT